jgi:hypothetical protein
MILIGPDIIAALKAHTFTLGKVTVRAAYSGTTPTCPMLTLDELPSNDGAYVDGLPCVVRNVLTLEAYAKDMSIQGVITPKRDAAYKLLMEADAFLNEQYGLTMIGQIQAAPYTDATIFRAVANYFAYIDTRTNTIYRSINKGV